MPHLSRFLSGLALMLTLPLSGCLDTGPDVVCVDVERVLSQSKAAQQANEHLGKVQTILQNGLAAYQEELKKSPEEKRQQELRQGLALLQRQMALEQAAARDVVSKHMLAQIEAWRADKGDVPSWPARTSFPLLRPWTSPPRSSAAWMRAASNSPSCPGSASGPMPTALMRRLRRQRKSPPKPRTRNRRRPCPP